MAPGVMLETFAPKTEGVGNAGCPLHPQPRVQCVGSTRVSSPRSHRETPGIPARNGFNGFLRTLPGDRAFLSPSSRGLSHARTRSGRHASARLDAGVEASGPHDFAVRVSAGRPRAL